VREQERPGFLADEDPSFSTLRVLKGTDFAPFLTRHSRFAPVPENRSHRSMEKKPRSARFSWPGP
jgi:hypothetical protein